MKYRYLNILIILSLISCKKETTDIPSFSEARYKVTITGLWKSPQFGIPSNVHFTTFTGMIHNDRTFLWKEGFPASTGVENVAEIGDRTALLSEINTQILNKNALGVILIAAPGATTTAVETISCNSDFSFISFESMIAPSPDWFVGIDRFNLFNNKQWIADVTLNLYAHDAGTEEGDVFGYDNPATVPQQSIQLLIPSKATVLANGNNELSAIATVRLTKL